MNTYYLILRDDPIEAIAAGALSRLSEPRYAHARLRGRYLDPPLMIPVDLAVALARPSLLAKGQVHLLIDHLNLMLLGGRMQPALRQSLIDTMAGITDTSATGHVNRVRAASFLVLASPEYLSQP